MATTQGKLIFPIDTQHSDKRAADKVVTDFERLTGLIWEVLDKETTDSPGRVLSSVTSKNKERLGAENQLLKGEERSTSKRKTGEEEEWAL